MTFKLEVGKTYVDGKGAKYKIVACAPEFMAEYVGRCTSGDIQAFYEDGKYEYYEMFPEEFNLIAEHKEPVVHEAWVVWFNAGDGMYIDVDFEYQGLKVGDWHDTHGKVRKVEKITYEEK